MIRLLTNAAATQGANVRRTIPLGQRVCTSPCRTLPFVCRWLAHFHRLAICHHCDRINRGRRHTGSHCSQEPRLRMGTMAHDPLDNRSRQLLRLHQRLRGETTPSSRELPSPGPFRRPLHRNHRPLDLSAAEQHARCVPAILKHGRLPDRRLVVHGRPLATHAVSSRVRQPSAHGGRDGGLRSVYP